MRAAAILLLCVTAVLPAHGESTVGNAAYAAGDYATAYEQWLVRAEEGSAQAQFNLGLLFAHGKGREVDLEQAAAWYLRSAESGFPRGQYAIAEIYESGSGVEQDFVQARKWFKLAGKQKYEDARKRKRKLAERMTPEEIALGDMWAREWEEAQEAKK